MFTPISLKLLVAGLLSVVLAIPAMSAEPATGPVVPSYGPVLLPPEGSYNLDKAQHYKVSIDIGETAEFPGDLNRKLISVARFLNMHAQSGVPRENIDFAVVVHGQAANDLLTNAAHQSRLNTPNPNTALLDELQAAGVSIYLCSQTVAFRGMGFGDFHPGVTMALSAMTSHVRLQEEGYTLIPF